MGTDIGPVLLAGLSVMVFFAFSPIFFMYLFLPSVFTYGYIIPFLHLSALL